MQCHHSQRDNLGSSMSFNELQEENLYPVIGILSHPGDGASKKICKHEDCSYIYASYVRFVQAGGARVIPLIWNEPREQLLNKLKLVDGIILTGGRKRDEEYYHTASFLYTHALERNRDGQKFPLLAICLGFQILCKILNDHNEDIIESHVDKRASTLDFTPGLELKATMFERFPSYLVEKMKRKPLVQQSHDFAVSVTRFNETPKLRDFFNVLTTSLDQNGERYISTIQARDYPILGVMWHPEKPQFEWNGEITHSSDAIQVAQHVSNFFISEARTTRREDADLTGDLLKDRNQKIRNRLICNHNPHFRGKDGIGAYEIYLFMPNEVAFDAEEKKEEKKKDEKADKGKRKLDEKGGDTREPKRQLV